MKYWLAVDRNTKKVVDGKMFKQKGSVPIELHYDYYELDTETMVNTPVPIRDMRRDHRKMVDNLQHALAYASGDNYYGRVTITPEMRQRYEELIEIFS